MTGPSATLPATWAPLEAALRQRHPVWVYYHGLRRLVCPHALGWKNEKPMLLAYQSGGQTTNGELAVDPRKRWRCLFVDEVDDVAVDRTAKNGRAPATTTIRALSAPLTTSLSPFPLARQTVVRYYAARAEIPLLTRGYLALSRASPET